MNNKKYEDDKKQIASSLGINYDSMYNGNMSTKDSGKIGGYIGGNMVRTLIYIAEKNLQEEYDNN